MPCGATVLICMPSPYIEPDENPGIYGALITILSESTILSIIYAPLNVFVNTLIVSPVLVPWFAIVSFVLFKCLIETFCE